MDEIEYKLKTNNSVLIVNAIDKLITTIKCKYKPAERQRFVLENEELKFLRVQCSSENTLISLTAYQGLLALVELGVLEIGHTMSTVITLLPSAHNYSATISTIAGLLILDLRSHLIPGQPYKCQFSLKSPQHPLISVLEKNKDAEDDVLVQMHALCTHPEYKISTNSLELLKSVFFWLTCNPQRSNTSIRPWQMLLSLPQTTAQALLLLDCMCCQQISNKKMLDRAFAAYSAVVDTAVYQQRCEHVMAFLPFLARISNEMLKNGRDPRACYSLMERCFALDAPELKTVAGITLMLLAENLAHTSALYLHELFNLCLNIISKYEYSALSLNAFTALSLQWLHLPSHLTSEALKVASKILDININEGKEDSGLYMPNLLANRTFQTLLYTDGHLYGVFKLIETWERVRDEPGKLRQWIDTLIQLNDLIKLDHLPFFLGIIMEKRKDKFDKIILKAIKVVIELVAVKKDVSVIVLPVLLYMIANDPRPCVKLECLRGLPLMAKTKENVPVIVSILSKLKTDKGVPTSLLIMLYASLSETQVRCFPYLQEMLVDSGIGRPDDLKWEIDMAKAVAVKRICELRASSHGLELVSVISMLLNKCTDRQGAAATALALGALAALWRGAAVAPPGTWRALEPRLGGDQRPAVQIGLCGLLSEVPQLRAQTPEYERLVREAARRLWQYVAESHRAEVAAAACDALAQYRLEDFKLADMPEIYRRTVKLPASYCKTPADAARRPEDVLDYIPSEVWPEVFRCTNEASLPGVRHAVGALLERELRAYRSGVYMTEGRGEPHSYSQLAHASVARGLMDCVRKQVTSPSYEYSDTVLLAMLETLSAEYLKPLPPIDLCFAHEAWHRSAGWRAGCIKLAARQSSVSPSARRLADNFLQGVQPGKSEEFDILLMFENLHILCRGLPPNSLRGPLECCLGDSFRSLPKSLKEGDDEPLFITQLRYIKESLACERLHDANRTLLSQLVETYFSVVPVDSVAWPAYVECCRNLSTKYLERMTSPSGWWEVTGEALRRSCCVRGALAAAPDCSAPLVWLNELVDTCAQHASEQEYSLRCMLPALRQARPDADATRDWFLQLMARTQVAFNETDDEAAKLYLCDVFMLSAIAFSGVWSFQPDSERLVCCRAARSDLLPAAVVALLSREPWGSCTLQLLEWLCHTRGATRDGGVARCCQRALLALRHTDQFTTHRIWTRLESHFAVPDPENAED